MNTFTAPALIPELDVVDLNISVAFYVKVIGFEIAYRRDKEDFVYLTMGDVHLMLETLNGTGRRFHPLDINPPFGLGINLQIRVPDVVAIHDRVIRAGFHPLISLESRWMRIMDVEAGNKQFVIADPDCYLLRFFTDLGQHPPNAEQ